jgi:HEAT repeat protein
VKRAHALLAAGLAIGAIGLAFALRDREPPPLNGAPAQPVGPESLAPADSLAADLLARIRGLDPVACELASRAIRSRNWWGSPYEPAASDDPRVTAIVHWALDAGGPSAVSVLGGGLGDPDPCVRRVAAIRLGRIEDRTALDRLRRSLESPSPDEREVAALGLGISENPDAVPALVQHLEDDESPRVRRAAAWALGEIE